MEITKEESIDRRSLYKHQDILKELSQLDPDESLRKIAEDLRVELNCEAVSILLWNEGEQKLITELQCGMSIDDTGPERYGPSEGITGKYIFSQGRLINCQVDIDAKDFIDKETNSQILDDSINWHYVQVFKKCSKLNDFKSLLGAPCFNQDHKPGVVKLINKINRETGQLDEEGFSSDDVQTLKLFLKTIEFILQSKWNEKRIEDLYTKSTNLAGSYDEVLSGLVHNCAAVLNYRACIVRLLENGWLYTKACNLEPLPVDEHVPADDPSTRVVNEKLALKWSVYPEDIGAPMVFRSFDGVNHHFPKPSRRITSFIQTFHLKSALIVPIIHGDMAIGTFECYTFLPHDFSHQEKDVVSKYANSLINPLKSSRETERLSQIERLSEIINDVLSRQTLTELYELLLQQTIAYFGFHYGAISRVDHKAGRVKTVSGATINKQWVNPDDWKELSDYSLDAPDILVDIIKNKKSEIISGPEVERKWDPRLNKQIYDKYNHKELIRIYVPFILRKTGTSARSDEKGAKIIEEKVLGVIEAGYHISAQQRISGEQRALFELFINYCAGAFQRLILDDEKTAFDKILEKLNPHEHMLSSAEEIYAIFREIVEDYLKVKAVSIWEKSATSEPYTLKLVAASESWRQQYDEEQIEELPQDPFTAEAIKSGRVVEVTAEEVKSKNFAYQQIALKNNLDSMVVIPISIGQEIYAVVHVFFRPDQHLTAEQKEFLEHFTGRAAVVMIAVQNDKLINSFSNISEKLLEEDIETILQSIAESAMEVLHANPVILFQYESEQNKFMPDLITTGHFFYPAVKDLPTEVKGNDWPNIILNMDEVAQYVDSEQEYLKFQERVGRVWRGDRFKSDFWHREQIASLAALRLEHKGKPVGVMFVNYRTPQKFNKSTEKLIKAFAAQAASAIARNREFWETNRRDSFSLSVSEIVASLSHNAANLLNVAAVRFAMFENYVKKAEGKTIDKDKTQGYLNELKEPWDELVADFNRLEEYRKFDDFVPESCQVESLIDNALLMLKNKFEKKRLVIQKNYSASPTPQIPCDKLQVQHMLLNMLINAEDAMGRRGTLSIGTEVKDRCVVVRITDNGQGISLEDRPKVFKPFFTTKKHGSGLGLPISRYIARKHGGRIDFTSKIGKETTFFIYLPVQRRG